MLKDSPAAQALIEYLTSAEAAEAWASRGIGTPNRNIDESVYPDDLVRTTSSAMGEAEILRFDLSDLQPSAFGGTVGQGLFKLFQDFLKQSRRHRRDHAADGGRRGGGLRAS